MTSAAYALHLAAVAALRADATLTGLGIAEDRDVTVEPSQGQALPYLVLTGPTEAERGKTSTSAFSDATVSLTAFAATLDRAMDLAEAAAAALADRDSPLTASGFTVAGARLDLLGPPQRDPGTEAARPWGVPLRVRYTVSRAE